MRKPFRIDDRLAEHYRDVLPAIREQLERGGEQSVRLVVWLVGLTTGVIALLVTQLTTDQPVVGPIPAAWTVGLLGLAVVFGVLHRVWFQAAEVAAGPQLLNLQIYLMGLTDTAAGCPLELQEYWDVPRIAQELKDEFGLDYGFLVDYGVSLDDARTIYMGIYERHETDEKEGIRKLEEVIADTFGIPDGERRYSSRTAPADWSRGAAGIRIRRLYAVSEWLFLGTALAFIAAVIVVTAAIIINVLP